MLVLVTAATASKRVVQHMTTRRYGAGAGRGSNIGGVHGSTEDDAARALGRGDALHALSLVGRIETSTALVLRGIAYAQLGDLELARDALSRGIEASTDARESARARAALVEIALLDGDPGPAARAARASIEELRALGDNRNATMQTLVLARAEVLLGRLNEASHVVETILAKKLPSDLEAVAWLAMAEIAVRSVAATRARSALRRAEAALVRSPHPLLSRALDALSQEISRPVARLLRDGDTSAVDLFAVEAASRGEILLVDGCRQIVVGGRVIVPLARRPILFALLAALARAWPGSITRDELAARGFSVQRVNASHRARLRVELGRLRKLMEGLDASPIATPDGYRLASTRSVAVLLPPTDDEDARISILLGDGAAWSAQGLAEHAGVSKRTAQRLLAFLVERGAATRTGTGRDLRYTRTGTPIASRMLLLGLVPKI